MRKKYAKSKKVIKINEKSMKKSNQKYNDEILRIKKV